LSAPEQFAAKLTLLDVLRPVPMPDLAKADRHMIANDKRMPGEAHVELLTKQEAMNAKIVKRSPLAASSSFYEIINDVRTLKADLIIRARE
jgi:hypothetical protein